MTTLITGSSGFVGLALAERLLASGEDVVGFDLRAAPVTARAAFATLPGRFDEYQGDVRSAQDITRAMQRCKPRQVVTLAAVTAGAERERLAPQSIFEVNLCGVLTAVNAAADQGVSRVVQISSGSVYGATGRDAALLCEDASPLLPEGLYGLSKSTAEEAAVRLAGLRGLPLVIGRLGTCFGPWEADTGVRDTLSAPLQILEIARRGGTAILPRDSRRDWLYVRDAAQAIVDLLAQPAWKSSVYNLGAGFLWSLSQWCERLGSRHCGFSWRIAGPDETPNINLYADYDRAAMAIDRLRDDTGFAPRFDLDAADHDFHHWLALTAGMDKGEK